MIDLGVLLVLGAMSLPFVTAEDWGQRAMAADALPALLLVLPIFVITLLPDHSQPVPAPLGWIALFLAATALPYAVIKYLDASTLAQTLGGSVGMGARLLVVGAFVTLAGLVLGLVRRLLGLPATGTYPARAETVSLPAAPHSALQAGGNASAPAVAGTSGPAAPRPSTSAPDSDAAPSSTAQSATPAVPPRPAQPPPRRPAPPIHPAPDDPDTEPTLPGLKKARPWWPDDLEDLFS